VFRLLLYLLLNRADSYLKKLTEIPIAFYVIYILCWQVFRLLLYLLLNRADSYLKKLTENEEAQTLIVFYVICVLCWQVFRLLLYLLLNRADSYLKKLTENEETQIFSNHHLLSYTGKQDVGGFSLRSRSFIPFRAHCGSGSSIKTHGS
jgi:hypothetical protein